MCTVLRTASILSCLCLLATPGCATRPASLGGADDEGGGEGEGGEDSSGDDGMEGGDSADDGGAIPVQCEGPFEVGLGTPRRLTSVQLVNTVFDLTGVALSDVGILEDRSQPFNRHSRPLGDSDRAVYATHAATAAAAVNVPSLVPCPEQDAACVDAFIDRWGRRAYRRAVTSGEHDALFAEYEAAGSFDDGIRAVVATALSADPFIVLRHSGVPHPDDGSILVLDDSTLAWRLSYFLWNGPPDEQLLDAAEAGALSTPDGLAGQADRLLIDVRAYDGIGELYAQMTNLSRLAAREGDAVTVDDPDLLAAMDVGVRRFAHHVAVGAGDHLIATLLEAPQGFANEPLAALYGEDILGPPPIGDGFALVDFDPERRFGLFGQAGVMAANAHPTASSPVLRGLMINDFLCQELPPPPPGVDTTLPPDGTPGTTRERYEQHNTDPACAGCHVLIDTFGFAFENYDAAGMYRTEENGNPIDTSGEVMGVSFDGAADLVDALLTDGRLADCTPQRYLEFALRRTTDSGDDCTLAVLRQEFQESGGDLRQLALAVVQSDGFLHERVVQ